MCETYRDGAIRAVTSTQEKMGQFSDEVSTSSKLIQTQLS